MTHPYRAYVEGFKNAMGSIESWLREARDLYGPLHPRVKVARKMVSSLRRMLEAQPAFHAVRLEDWIVREYPALKGSEELQFVVWETVSRGDFVPSSPRKTQVDLAEYVFSCEWDSDFAHWARMLQETDLQTSLP